MTKNYFVSIYRRAVRREGASKEAFAGLLNAFVLFINISARVSFHRRTASGLFRQGCGVALQFFLLKFAGVGCQLRLWSGYWCTCQRYSMLCSLSDLRQQTVWSFVMINHPTKLNDDIIYQVSLCPSVLLCTRSPSLFDSICWNKFL